MLSVVHGNGADAAAASLRAAVEALVTASDRVAAISLTGQLPNGERPNGSLIRLAARLAAEHDFILDLHLDAAAFEVRFRRRAAAG